MDFSIYIPSTCKKVVQSLIIDYSSNDKRSLPRVSSENSTRSDHETVDCRASPARTLSSDLYVGNPATKVLTDETIAESWLAYASSESACASLPHEYVLAESSLIVPHAERLSKTALTSSSSAHASIARRTRATTSSYSAGFLNHTVELRFRWCRLGSGGGTCDIEWLLWRGGWDCSGSRDMSRMDGGRPRSRASRLAESGSAGVGDRYDRKRRM
ncbi:hypothetical protein IW261DRAFT_118189 [Armillaria novae-zelandiae]|uniref:Uncharacterized protein n=1 Tax=Armillaria novae-zelandiae TaxID=153914 RepID=A0AA39PB56_9AGAR|nr:hypothetical protein IW261DRAFT_118189 [Armillaria novae-zelandiae]